MNLNNSYYNYLTQENGHWFACCLDYTLVAQAESARQAKLKLVEMVRQYEYDALHGQDKEYPYQLLNRKAPFSEWLKYYLLKLFTNNTF